MWIGRSSGAVDLVNFSATPGRMSSDAFAGSISARRSRA
jgi:hypothetical protein